MFMLTKVNFIGLSALIILTACLLFQYSCAVPKESDKKIAELDAAIEKDPNNVEAYYNRGKAYFEKKEYSKAVQDYQNVISKDPERMEALYDRACAYIEMEEWSKAMSDLDRYIDSPANEKSFKAMERRGYVYLRQGEYDNAIQECNKAINLNPGYMQAIATKGKAQKAKANQ
jgi:tetratricopeptide (TPR) repeat protein